MNDGKSGSLADRTALVTGGSRGVGAATSKLLAAKGANGAEEVIKKSLYFMQCRYCY